MTARPPVRPASARPRHGARKALAAVLALGLAVAVTLGPSATNPPDRSTPEDSAAELSSIPGEPTPVNAKTIEKTQVIEITSSDRAGADVIRQALNGDCRQNGDKVSCGRVIPGTATPKPTPSDPAPTPTTSSSP